MLRIVGQRLLSSVPVVLGVVIVVFVALRILPGDPVDIMATNMAMPAADMERLREQLGLNDPIAVQFANYLADLLRGDWGRSFFSNRSVAEQIVQQMPATIQLALAAVLVALLIGFPFGVIAAVKRNTLVDRAAMLLALIGVSMPTFWSGILLIWLFGVTLRWLPIAGTGSPRHLVLPAVALGLGLGDHLGGQPQLFGHGRPAADARVGRDAERGAQLSAPGVVGRYVSRPGDHGDGAGDQYVGRRPARCARSKNTEDLAHPANPANPASPANPANPANAANPTNAANPANAANPTNPGLKPRAEETKPPEGGYIGSRRKLVETATLSLQSNSRAPFFGQHRPPHTGLIVAGLGGPQVRVEVEVIAVDYALRQWGRETVERLLGPDVVVAHANGLAAGEIELLGSTRSNVASAPSTAENLWYGYAPIVELLEAGANVAIATDGAAPRFGFDLWKDISRAMWHQWLAHRSQEVLPPGKALRMVTIDAARALGMDGEIGSLEAGKRADVITVDLDRPHLTPQAFVPQLLTYYVNGNDVDTVIVDGRVLLRGGGTTGVDAEAILENARAEAARAFERIDLAPYIEIGRAFWHGPRY